MLNTPIVDIDMSGRTRNICKKYASRHNIQTLTLRDLAKATKKKLLTIFGCGIYVVSEIEKVLERYDLHLDMSEDELYKIENYPPKESIKFRENVVRFSKELILQEWFFIAYTRLGLTTQSYEEYALEHAERCEKRFNQYIETGL